MIYGSIALNIKFKFIHVAVQSYRNSEREKNIRKPVIPHPSVSYLYYLPASLYILPDSLPYLPNPTSLSWVQPCRLTGYF